jgi:hypothetical protein
LPATISGHGVPASVPSRAEPSPAAFAAWLARQADDYRALGSDRAVWLARQIDALARQARILEADTPSTFDDRLDAWEAAMPAPDGPKAVPAVQSVLSPDRHDPAAL